MNYKLFIIIPIFSLFTFFPSQCTPTKDAGVFLSFDNGESWQQKVFVSKKESIANLDVTTINLDPQNPKIIYLGTKGSGLWKSMDGGEVWYQIKDSNKALDKRANIYDVAIDPKDTNNIYIGTYQDKYGRLFRSKDAGRSWEEVYIVSRPKYAIFSVEVDSYESSVVYMGTAEGGFLKSTDYGKNWKLIKWFNDVISDIKINPKDTKIVYVATFRKGIYKTIDRGGTWQSFEDKLRNFSEAEKVEILIIDSQNPDILYSGSEYGLLKTSDNGQSWQKVNIIIPPETIPILSIAINPLNSDHIYYGAGSVLYKTLDKGKTWSVHNLPSNQKIKTIIINPQDINMVYVGMQK